MEGLLISFEGVEGSGKSTQMTALAQSLKAKGWDVLELREPGGTRIGEKVRQILLDVESQGLTPVAELCLYLASRAQMVDEVLRPALAEGKVVLCDRFSDSTLAYQGYGRGLDLEGIHRLNRMVTGGIMPDLTLLLDLDPEVGLVRSALGGLDRLEKEDPSFHKRVREGYLALAKKESKRVKVIPADGSREAIAARVLAWVEVLLKRRSRRSHGI